MGLLENKVIAITGGAAGQGRAHAVASAREGADVLLMDVLDPNADSFLETVELVEKQGRRAVAVTADTTKQAQLDAAVAKGIEELGQIDGLVVNAGIYRKAPFWEVTEEEWDLVIGVNLTGAWKACRAVAGHFRERKTGSIVLISSIDAFDPEVASSTYGISKTGVLGLSKYVARELGPFGVRANAIAPGFIDTPMVNTQATYDQIAGAPGAGTRQDLLNYGYMMSNLRGYGLLDPSVTADTAVYLNSDLARAVTGTVVPVDAGHLLLNRFNIESEALKVDAEA